jgi:DNA-binding response OmpR family regulator
MTEARILVVDDDEAIRELYKEVLAREGWLIHVAGDSDEALSIFRKEPLDAVILDIILPGIGGAEVCRHIRQVSDIPIIAVSGIKRSEIDKVSVLQLGADEYLIKPVSMVELVTRIRSIFHLTGVERYPPGIHYYNDSY